MVTLHITSINHRGIHREFSFGPLPIESAFILLNSLVNNDCTLLNVYYSTKSGGVATLPVELFDGQPISKEFKRLEQEWQAILQRTVN